MYIQYMLALHTKYIYMLTMYAIYAYMEDYTKGEMHIYIIYKTIAPGGSRKKKYLYTDIHINIYYYMFLHTLR